MSGWEKQIWIKDILSKSGNDVKEENEINKMVYYTALPLIMQTEQPSAQVCSNPNADVNNGRNSVAINYHQVPQTSQQSASSNHDHQNNHHLQSNNLNEEQQSNFNNFQQTSNNNNNNKSQQKPQFKCDQCHMNFGSKSAHTSHMKSHAKQYQNQNTFYTMGNIAPSSIVPTNSSTAVSAATSTEPYQCDVCKKTFAVPARLVRHYRTHTGERPFACEFCHKTFSVKENLQVHRRIHTKERPYKCDVCGRAFEHSGKLHRHMRIHTGERPHKCSVCGKTFIQSGQLVIHMRTHTGEKPYKCPVEGCGKGFTCSKQLKVHSRTHTGEKPYHCDICFRDFGYNHVLKLHRVQHYGSKCYKCTICDETFKSKKEMEAHIKGHANDLPDDEDQQNENISSVELNHRNVIGSPTRIKNEDTISIQSSPPSSQTLSETPKDSGSEANSDGDDITYYNMYSRFEQSINSYNNQSGGVNPALLAAASIAAAVNLDETNPIQQNHKRDQSMSPPSSQNTNSCGSNSAINIQTMQPPTQVSSSQSTSGIFMYETLPVMRHGFFASSAQTAEFRPSAASANLVRRVEEAIAIAEPLLTPPRSSPESPDRSSSPESDSIVMADRDIMSLPPRKRKLYLKDNQNTDSTPTIRMSSVIQFARAS